MTELVLIKETLSHFHLLAYPRLFGGAASDVRGYDKTPWDKTLLATQGLTIHSLSYM